MYKWHGKSAAEAMKLKETGVPVHLHTRTCQARHQAVNQHHALLAHTTGGLNQVLEDVFSVGLGLLHPYSQPQDKKLGWKPQARSCPQTVGGHAHPPHPPTHPSQKKRKGVHEVIGAGPSGPPRCLGRPGSPGPGRSADRPGTWD